MAVVTILDLNAGRPNSGVSAIRQAVAETGHEAVVVDVRGGDALPEAPEAIVATGGPGSPHEPGGWQTPFRRCLRSAVLRDTPLLAICYSFQVLSSELGARVQKLEHRRMGIFPMRRTQDGTEDSWLAASGGEVFEMRGWGVWRGDLKVLATGAEGDTTAARFGDHAVGCVFHPEAEPFSVSAWLDVPDNQAMLGRLDGTPSPEDMREAAPRLVDVREALLAGFLRGL